MATLTNAKILLTSDAKEGYNYRSSFQWRAEV